MSQTIRCSVCGKVMCGPAMTNDICLCVDVDGSLAATIKKMEHDAATGQGIYKVIGKPDPGGDQRNGSSRPCSTRRCSERCSEKRYETWCYTVPA